jgi:hypothetical protein
MINKVKSFFVEPKQAVQLLYVIQQYANAIHTSSLGKKDESHNGAVLLGVCRGKISEGLDFNDDMCRCVIMAGLPYQNRTEPKVRLKMDYMTELSVEEKQKNKGGKGSSNNSKVMGKAINNNINDKRSESDIIDGNIWYGLQMMRAVNQSTGRVIRHKNDYGSIILIDERYEQTNNLSSLAGWVREALAYRCMKEVHEYGKGGISGGWKSLVDEDEIVEDEESKEIFKDYVSSSSISQKYRNENNGSDKNSSSMIEKNESLAHSLFSLKRFFNNIPEHLRSSGLLNLSLSSHLNVSSPNNPVVLPKIAVKAMSKGFKPPRYTSSLPHSQSFSGTFGSTGSSINTGSPSLIPATKSPPSSVSLPPSSPATSPSPTTPVVFSMSSKHNTHLPTTNPYPSSASFSLSSIISEEAPSSSFINNKFLKNIIEEEEIEEVGPLPNYGIPSQSLLSSASPSSVSANESGIQKMLRLKKERDKKKIENEKNSKLDNKNQIIPSSSSTSASSFSNPFSVPSPLAPDVISKEILESDAQLFNTNIKNNLNGSKNSSFSSLNLGLQNLKQKRKRKDNDINQMDSLNKESITTTKHSRLMFLQTNAHSQSVASLLNRK